MTRGQAGSAGLQTGGRGPPQQQEARPRAAAATWPVEPTLSNVATRGVLKAREGTGRLSNPAGRVLHQHRARGHRRHSKHKPSSAPKGLAKLRPLAGLPHPLQASRAHPGHM